MKCCAAVVLCVAFCARADDVPNPSIVFIGDPHLNQAGQPATWIAQTNWIAANIAAWNIKAVLCAGDFDGGTINGPQDSAPNVTSGWTNGWSTIDGTGLPYLMTVGNHDYANNQPSTRDTTVFDAQLGFSRIGGKGWFGASWNDGASSRANEYILVTVGSHNLLIMALEFYPRPAAITWANGVILAHLDREVIIITHGYLVTGTGALIAWVDQWGPSTYSLPGDSYAGTNLAAWAALWPNNVHLLLSGHNDPPNFFQRLDGRLYGIMSDYQTASPSSQSILIIAFAASSITINNLNTTTGVLDTVTFPPLTLTWPAPPVKPTYTFAGDP